MERSDQPAPPELTELPARKEGEYSIFTKKRVAHNTRQWIHYTLSYGLEFSRLAFAYQMLQNVVIWISVVNFLISSMPSYWETNDVVVETIERVCVSIFTIDYIARLVTAKPGKRIKWVLKPIHIIDVSAVVPFYIELIIAGSVNFNPADFSVLVILRALRLFRMLRTFKIARYSTLIPMFVKALLNSKEGFILFTFNMVMLMIVLSAVMFYAEQTVMVFDLNKRVWVLPDGKASMFQSIPATFWWFIVTITTVGYGDTVPVSDLGKFVATFSMVIGFFILAVPLAVFGSNFTVAYDERQEKQRIHTIRNVLIKNKDLSDKYLVKLMNKRLRQITHKMIKQKEAYTKLVKEQEEFYQLLVLLDKKIFERGYNSDSDSVMLELDESQEYNKSEMCTTTSPISDGKKNKNKSTAQTNVDDK